MSLPPTYSSDRFDIREKTQMGVSVNLDLVVPSVLSFTVVGHGVLDSEVHGNKQCEKTKNTNGTSALSLSSVGLWLQGSFWTQGMSLSRLNRRVEVLNHIIHVRNEEDVVELDHGSSLMGRLVRSEREEVRWE